MYDHAEALKKHTAGMLAGTVYAKPRLVPVPFGGQRNFGALGPADEGNTIPRFAIETSDGWLYQFHDVKVAHGFFRAHRKGRK